jgi:hypothetical protein
MLGGAAEELLAFADKPRAKLLPPELFTCLTTTVFEHPARPHRAVSAASPHGETDMLSRSPSSTATAVGRVSLPGWAKGW